jgi:hypothetical protein
MVVHTAESTPDFVAFDGGAEAVANFIRTRDTPGSYHDLCDSDSCINLVAYSNEAYQDGTGSNRHAWGGSIATRADVWPLAPVGWRKGAIDQLASAAARYAKWLRKNHGVIVPARRINRAQSEARMPGFISHGERDPGRRTDPGLLFPWAEFLAAYARKMGATPTPEDDDMTPADLNKALKDGELRKTFKALIQGSGLDALREPTKADPDNGSWRGQIEKILDEQLEPDGELGQRLAKIEAKLDALTPEVPDASPPA